MAYPLLIWLVVNGKTNDQTGGNSMDSMNRIFFAGAVISAAAAVFLASGCAGTGAASMQRAAEVRVATTLEAGSPKMMVSGPARLLHVDVEGHQTLNVYTVKRDAAGEASCAVVPRASRSAPQARSATTVFSGSRTPALRAGAAEARTLRQAASTELNLEVGEDEVVCLANVAGDASRVDVSWHARRGVAAPIEKGHTLTASNP